MFNKNLTNHQNDLVGVIILPSLVASSMLYEKTPLYPVAFLVTVRIILMFS